MTLEQWRRALVAVGAVLLLTTGGCTNSAPPVPADEAPTTAGGPSATSQRENARGNIPKRLGEKAYGNCPADAVEPSACTVEFTVDRITPCKGTGYHGDPVDGVRRIVWWHVTTRSNYGTIPDTTVTFSSADLRLIGPDGDSRSIAVSSYWECVPRPDQFPQYEKLQPSTSYVGGMEVVMPVPAGTLVFAPNWANGGWEWPVAG
jgi:hypothetical protein